MIVSFVWAKWLGKHIWLAVDWSHVTENRRIELLCCASADSVAAINHYSERYLFDAITNAMPRRAGVSTANAAGN